MTFRPELLDELLQGYENPEDLLGNEGILKQLTVALVERCLNAEMKTHMEEQSSEVASEGKAGGQSSQWTQQEDHQGGVRTSPDRSSP